MLEIDGSGGGGQLLRTALSLAAVTGRSFRLRNVRGSRPEPGLRPQHLAAVRTMARLCDADTDGARLGSASLTFRPGSIRPRELTADIGTAGSVTLLFDAVLPLATRLPRPIRLTATGGTDVRWSPTLAYLRRVKLPLLRRHGLDARVDPGRTGFYPAGGGRCTLRAGPSSLSPLRLVDRGSLVRFDLFSKASTGLADHRVAERQVAAAVGELERRHPDVPLHVDERYVAADSPGSSLLLTAVYEHTVAGFDALGERGKPAETVGSEVVTAFEEFHEGSAAVDEHAADQLLVFLALVGGRISVPRLTPHVESNRDVLAEFGPKVAVERPDDGRIHLTAPTD